MWPQNARYSPFVLAFCLFVGFGFGVAKAQETPPSISEQDVIEQSPAEDATEELAPDEALAAENWYTVEGLSATGRETGDFVVGPGKVEVVVSPGEEQVVFVSVSNRLGESRIFEISVEDAEGSRDPAAQPVHLLGDDYGPYTLKDYLSVPQYSFRLAHNERARVPVTIAIPPDAEPGGRYGSVLVKTVTREGERDSSGITSQSPIVARIGTLFFVTIPGDIVRAGEVIDFSTIPKKSWYQSGPVTLGVTFENRGDVHLTPSGEIRITNLSGEEVGYVELDPWFVYPNAIRLREVTWNREALLGRYTATLTVASGYNDTVETKEIVFYVIPFHIIGGVVLGLFLLFLIIRYIGRNFEFRRRGG